MSLELTRIDRLPMTSCSCSTVNKGLSRTVSEINGGFGPKLLVFQPRDAPLRDFLLEFLMAVALKKLGHALPHDGKSLTIICAISALVSVQ